MVTGTVEGMMISGVDTQTQKDLLAEYSSGDLFGPLFDKLSVREVTTTEVGPRKFPGLRFTFGDGKWMSVAYAGSKDRFSISLPEAGKVYEGITRRQLRGAVLWRGGARDMAPRYVLRSELGFFKAHPAAVPVIVSLAVAVACAPFWPIASAVMVALALVVWIVSKGADKVTSQVTDNPAGDVGHTLAQGWYLIYTRALLDSIYQACQRSIPSRADSPIWADLQQAGAGVTDLVDTGDDEAAERSIAALEELREVTVRDKPTEAQWMEGNI